MENWRIPRSTRSHTKLSNCVGYLAFCLGTLVFICQWRMVLATDLARDQVPDTKTVPEPIDGSVVTSEQDQLWCKPQQVHLSCSKSTTKMVVMWATRASCNSPTVVYSENIWNLTGTGSRRAAESQPVMLNKEKGSLRFVHRAVLSGLRPSTTYFFRPVTKQGFGSKPMYFRSLPAPSPISTVSLLVSNSLDRLSESVVEQEVSSGTVTAVMYNGDIDGQLVSSTGQIENDFMSSIEQITAYHPFMVVSGLKSEGKDGGGRYLYQQMFSLPGVAWPVPQDELWYSFDAGLVHIISYSTQVLLSSNTTLIEKQKKWLLKDLTEANKRRDTVPWVVAFGRDPMYCIFSKSADNDCAKNASKVRHGVEDLFYVFGVDLVIESASSHYERSKPKYKGVSTNLKSSYEHPRAPVEIVMGSSMSAQPLGADTATNGTGIEPPDWLAFSADSRGADNYGKLTVFNSSHLRWELLSATERRLLDTFVIMQETHGNFNLASLPHNVSHQINQTIIAQGGKPGTYDFITGADGELGRADGDGGWSQYSVYLGLSTVAAVLGLVIALVGIRSCIKRRRYRRWHESDMRDGSGQGFHSVGSGSDTEEEDNDFEIDVYDKQEGGKQSSKLLTSY